MNLPSQIAVKFLRRKNSKIPSFTAWVSVLGVTVGVAAFLVVVTVLNSFSSQLKSILQSANPHLIVYSLGGMPDASAYKVEMEDLLKKHKPDAVDTADLFLYNEGILTSDGASTTVIIRAINGEQSANGVELKRAIEPPEALAELNNEASVLFFKKPLVKPKLILGKGLAQKLSVKKGDIVHLLPGGKASDPLSGNNTAFEVGGILTVGLAEYDEKLLFMNYRDGLTLFGQPDTATGIEFRLRHPDDAIEISRFLQNESSYSVRAWQEINARLFAQIERDGNTIQFVVFLISFVAAFNIIATLSLGVMDRTRQIALLRSLGASRLFIMRVFLSVGLLIGAIGAALGIVMATLLLKLFANFDIGELKSFYFLEKIPVEFDFKLMFMSYIIAVLISFLSALIPAYRATRVSPLYGLKPGQKG